MIASAHSIDCYGSSGHQETVILPFGSGEGLHLVEIPIPTAIAAPTSSPTQMILVIVVSTKKNCS
jgi:hypothetical protein